MPEHHIIEINTIVPGLILALVGAFMNWFFRGGGIETALLGGRNMPGGKIVNAVSYGVTSWLLSGSAWIGALSAVGMAIGQAPAWGGFIAAMRGQSETDSVAWGIEAMTVRGLFWGTCLSLPVIAYWYVNHFVDGNKMVCFVIATMMAGAAQGVVYYGMIRLFAAFRSNGNTWFNDWTCAEMAHGALLWVSLIYFL